MTFQRALFFVWYLGMGLMVSYTWHTRAVERCNNFLWRTSVTVIFSWPVVVIGDAIAAPGTIPLDSCGKEKE